MSSVPSQWKEDVWHCSVSLQGLLVVNVIVCSGWMLLRVFFLPPPCVTAFGRSIKIRSHGNHQAGSVVQKPQPLVLSGTQKAPMEIFPQEPAGIISPETGLFCEEFQVEIVHPYNYAGKKSTSQKKKLNNKQYEMFSLWYKLKNKLVEFT